MPTLRSGKVWQVIRNFGVLFFAIYISLRHRGKYCNPIYFPSKYGYPNNVPGGQKMVEETKKVLFKNVLIPSTNACYLTIASKNAPTPRPQAPPNRSVG